MSQYTTQVRWIVEMNSSTGKSVTERCKEAAPKIFPADWEFYDETKKLDFEGAFLRHFYTQEICCETVGLWKVFLEDWLYARMPYFNLKLQAMHKQYDFLDAFDYTEQSLSGETGTNKTTSETNRNSTMNQKTDTTDNGSGHSFVKNYDFPSNNIDAITDHITSATESDTTAENQGNVEENRTENSNEDETQNANHEINKNLILTRKGRAGTAPGDLLKAYYAAIENVYMEIFNDAEFLFMGVW